jgi:hypothetical protein
MRRSAMVLLVAATAATATTACGASSKPTAAQNQAAVSAAWSTFFNAKTAPAASEALLQNGASLAPQIAALRKLMPPDLTATIDAVTVTGTSAKVSYKLMSGGKSLLGQYDSTGTAILVGKKWLVSQGTFCGLSSLAGAPCAS